MGDEAQLTMTDRAAHLAALIERGAVLRGRWTAGTQGPTGYERACLLAALSPEVGEAESASACPASVMPAWLAHLTPGIDDHASDEAWPGIVRRYASLAARWSVLDADAWERARRATTIAILREAREHAAETTVLSAIDGVIAWIAAGEPEGEREAVRRAAEASAAAWAAEASAWAAEASAGAAAWAAEAAAWAAEASAWAAEASARAAEASAWNRIAAAALDAIEAEVVRAESGVSDGR